MQMFVFSWVLFVCLYRWVGAQTLYTLYKRYRCIQCFCPKLSICFAPIKYKQYFWLKFDVVISMSWIFIQSIAWLNYYIIPPKIHSDFPQSSLQKHISVMVKHSMYLWICCVHVYPSLQQHLHKICISSKTSDMHCADMSGPLTFHGCQHCPCHVFLPHLQVVDIVQ